MKVTRLGATEPLASLTGMLGGSSVGPSGQVPTSNGSNAVAWGSNVATVFANGSNLLMGPTLNLASGSNIVFTFDGISGSNPSNTLRIHSTGTGGGSSSLTVADEGVDLATAATKLDFVGAGVVASGTGATKTITIAGGEGGATIQYGSLKPATPDYDFDTTDMTGWSAHSVSGSFVIGQAFPQAIDGSHLLIPYKTSQRGLLYRSVGNTDFDIIVGGLRMKAPGAGDHMPGIAILNSSGTGVGIVQYNDNNVYLANITTWAYASFVQQISKYGHNVNAANLTPGDEVPYFLRLQRATNSWTASISITGSAWDDVTASSSVTITADRFAIGNFLNDRPGHFICDFIDGI